MPLLKIKYKSESESYSLFRMFEEGIDPSDVPLIPISLLIFIGITILNGIFLLIAIVRLSKKDESKACKSLKNMLIGNAINYIFSLLMNSNIQSEYFGSYSEYVHISGFVIFMLLGNITGAVAVTYVSEKNFIRTNNTAQCLLQALCSVIEKWSKYIMSFKKILSIFLTAALCMGCISCGDESSDSKKEKTTNKQFEQYIDDKGEDSNNRDDKAAIDDIGDKIVSDEESIDEMYQIALKLMDTDITARMNDDQALSESLFPPDDNLKERYYDYYPLNKWDSYQLVQFLLLEVDEDIFKGPDTEEVWIGVNVEKAYQICSYIRMDSKEYDEPSEDYIENIILKIDGKWYYFNDFSILKTKNEDVGVSASYVDIKMSKWSSIDGTVTYVLQDGTEITKEEYEASFEIYYGYFVEKNEDGTFSLYDIAEDGTVVLDDETTFKVRGSEIIS